MLASLVDAPLQGLGLVYEPKYDGIRAIVLVEPGTPIPTPWSKEEFERYTKEIQQRRREIRAANRPESEMDALFREEQRLDMATLNRGPYAGKVGAFEGAVYEAKGYYRPEVDCIMFTRSKTFCAVCRRAIERVISLYT